MANYKYIEIIKDSTGEVVLRMDVSNRTDRQIERILNGASINLNHDEYSLIETESDIELKIIDER